MPRRDKYEAQHAKNRVLYEQKIKQIFTKVCQECGMSVTQLASLVESAGENAEIAKIPAVRKVLDKLHSRLAKELKTVVIDGIKAEWKLANSKYDALVGTMVAGDLLEQMKEEQREKMMAQNLAARDAFIARKEDGLNLSQKVWNYSGQMRDAIESSLEFGIWEGRSAAEIARDLKQYLVYPDKLFRRIRIKAEEEGKEDKFRLSKAAAAFHPGQGMYRSSYKNALRLALNETNIAYRKADTMRRVGLNFVVGIEVHLSNNHNCKGVPEGEFFDICDLLQGKYPPDFEFVGWHPACRCWTSTILNTEDEFFRDSDGVYRGSVNEVKGVPPQFKKWLEENKDRITKAEKRGKLPYFLRDNRWAWQEDAERPNEKKVNTALVTAEERHAARTPEQIQAIKDRWAIRGRAIRNSDRILRLIDSVPGMREYLKGEVGTAMSILDGEQPFKGDYNKLDKVAIIVKNQMRHLRSELDVLDKPWEVLKEHGVEKTVEAAASVRNKMAQWSGTTLEYQLKKLKFEADWIEKNKKGVLSTWKVAQDAYLKAARRVEWEIEWKPIIDELNTIAASPYADPDMVAEVRSYIGKDKEEAEYALSHLKIDTEKNELEDKFEGLYRQAPGAFNANFRKSWEDALEEAFDSAGIKELRMIVATAKTIISLYHDLVNEAAEKLAYVKDQKVADALSKAVAKQEISGLQDALELADREIKFQGYVAEAEKMLQQRDLLLKLKPQVVTWLEERSLPKDYSSEDIVKLKGAVDNARWAIDEWEKKKQAYADHFQYMQAENIKSKAYKDLVMELRQAILDIDVAKVDELLPKVDEQKAKHENEKAYRAGVEAEWEKMKDDVARISDALNADTDLLSKAATSGLLSLVVDFNANESGARKLREGRKAYKQILDLADKLGINLSPFSQSYSQERKDKAVWDTKEKAEKEGRIVGQLADSILFDPASKAWLASMANDAAVDALRLKLVRNEITQSEFERVIKAQGLKVYTYVDEYGGTQYLTQREAIYEYTSHYCDKNEPLRNMKYSNRQSADHFYAKVNAITDIISTCVAPEDMWFQRGDDDLNALFGRLGFAGVTVPDEVKKDSHVPSAISDEFVASLQQFVGQICTDGGFLSLGSAKGQGMRKPVIVNVFVPKGTAIMYLEPFSAFGNGVCSVRWDGKTRCKTFEGEFESLLQRGTQMRITKIYKGPDLNKRREVIYIDAEVVGQDVKDLSYVKKSNIGR